MNDADLRALRSFDRPHLPDQAATRRLQERMFAAYEEGQRQAGLDKVGVDRDSSSEDSKVTLIEVVGIESAEPSVPSRRILSWVAAAAIVVVAAAVVAVFPERENPTSGPNATSVISDEEAPPRTSGCRLDVDSASIALDRYFVNTTEANRSALDRQLAILADTLRLQASDDLGEALDTLGNAQAELEERLLAAREAIERIDERGSCRAQRFRMPDGARDFVPEPPGVVD